jgi:hypothetical protein
MSFDMVRIRELAAWGFDSYEYRPADVERTQLSRATGVTIASSPFAQSNMVLAAETEKLREKLALHANRPDLLVEMSGLSWSLGVVNLRSLIAFQRRLSFDTRIAQPVIPAPDDWDALLKLSFGPPKSIEHEAVHERASDAIILRSDNPNLHLRVTNDPATPLIVHAGSPFFEVARFRNRWFLRDGYHRAYALLKANVYEVPAVIVEATTLEELGANKSWFFAEEFLFSSNPPRVVDFLNEDLVIEYDRPPLIKTVIITMEETLKPATAIGEQA